jgi:prevent-host-death family protein
MEEATEGRKADSQRVEVTSDEGKNQFGELFNRAGYGNERIVITRFGKPSLALLACGISSGSRSSTSSLLRSSKTSRKRTAHHHTEVEMISMRTSAGSLATHQRAAAIDDRVACRRLRVALAEVVGEAPSYPQPRWRWDDLNRNQPRSSPPFAREREMIHGAMRRLLPRRWRRSPLVRRGRRS